MAEHVNFYENLNEAELRLRYTVVMYDGDPYYILAITDHMNDGIFRVYLDPLGRETGPAHHNWSIPYEAFGAERGKKMDEFLTMNPSSGVLRKQMDSPKFNRFRPFPLGMINDEGRVKYLERQPQRHTQQGLTDSMIYTHPIEMGAVPRLRVKSERPSLFSVGFYNTVKGIYPSVDEAYQGLIDPAIGGNNEGVAFHRDFAFIRGPLGLIFLAYKEDIVGYMPNGDFSKLIVPASFRHTKEVISELGIFADIRT